MVGLRLQVFGSIQETVATGVRSRAALHTHLLAVRAAGGNLCTLENDSDSPSSFYWQCHARGSAGGRASPGECALGRRSRCSARRSGREHVLLSSAKFKDTEILIYANKTYINLT